MYERGKSGPQKLACESPSTCFSPPTVHIKITATSNLNSLTIAPPYLVPAITDCLTSMIRLIPVHLNWGRVNAGRAPENCPYPTFEWLLNATITETNPPVSNFVPS